MDLNLIKTRSKQTALSDLRKPCKVKLGGGSSKIEKQHAKGKMTAHDVLTIF